LRNLITALAAVLIIGVAGAVYYATGEKAPSDSKSTAGTGTPATQTGATQTGATQTGATQTAQAENQPSIGADEHVLGAADAPVTIIEYASMTCPHCAAFHKETMPRIKSEFIDKGLVRFVFRPFPLDQLAAAASLLAQCAPGEGYFSMLDILFRTQKEWVGASDRLAALKQIGRTAGLADADIDRCLADQAVIDRIVAGIEDAQKSYKIDSTPTFLVNGKKYSNAPFDDYEDEGTTKPGFGRIIRELLPKT